MVEQRLHLLLWCAAISLLAFVVLDYWSSRNAPIQIRFERMWRDDVALLEGSTALPKQWFDVSEVEIFGGTPETKGWLRKISPPIAVKTASGQHKLEVLVVAWEEEGIRGVLVQYNLVDLKSKNMIWELGRTIILSPKPLGLFHF